MIGWIGLLLGGLMGCVHKHTFVHQNMDREYYLYRPRSAAENAPLLLMMHGYQGDALFYSRFVGVKKVARQNGFVVAFPQGTKNHYGVTHWNAQLAFQELPSGPVDDIGFLTNLAQYLQETESVDPNRTYATGISNGGFMSYTLACTHPEVFKGVGSLIGTMSGETWRSCNMEVPVPIFQVSGSLDSRVPIDGSITMENGWGGAPHIHEVMAFWGEHNQCQSHSTGRFTGNTTYIRYDDCAGEGRVLYYEVEDMEHWLPNPRKDGFGGFEEMWLFFEGE